MSHETPPSPAAGSCLRKLLRPVPLVITLTLAALFAGVLLVRDGGHAPHRISLGPANTYVVPSGYTVLHTVWHGVPPIGRITASAVIHILINDKPYRTYTSQTLTLTFFPWAQAAAALMGLVLLLVLAFATRRRWRRWLRERRAERAALATFRAQRRAQKGAHQP